MKMKTEMLDKAPESKRNCTVKEVFAFKKNSFKDDQIVGVNMSPFYSKNPNFINSLKEAFSSFAAVKHCR